MYISELDLFGFKSFAHKTKVRFDSGITAIVGPNGCGKSNIVDSLRWVLGEQRPSLLRSTSMNNVIFNGTARRRALGLAEVSLTLVNNKGILPTEYNEVTITRRLYRSGDSEYLINNTPCRLKDIMELFMDTGMGADAYSVIELKMVEEILNDRNNDRRKLFEEAAGVTRYKDKRKQALRKLDETLKDLQRIDDILVEVRKKAQSLGVQAEKATRAREYRSELEALDKASNRREYQNIIEELEPLKERITHAEKEKWEIHSSLETSEAHEERARHALHEREREEAEHRRHSSQIDHAIREMETLLRITREKIKNEEGVIRQYEEDINQSSTDLRELKEARQSSIDRLESFSKELVESEMALKASKDRYGEIQQQFTRVRHQIYELEIESGELGKKQNDLQTERVKLESRLESTEDDLGRIAEDISQFRTQIAGLEEESTRAGGMLEQLDTERDRKVQELERAVARRKSCEEDREKTLDKIRELKSRRDALQSEISLVEEMARSRDLFPASVAWLTEEQSDQFERLVLVTEIFHTDEAHAHALEAALGEAINFVVVDSVEDAVKGLELLRNHEQGRATFVPVSELRQTHEAEHGSILNVVKVEKGYESLAALLLGSTLLAEDIEQAREMLKSGGSAAVTPEGEMVTADHLLRGGSKNQQAGVRLGLKDKLGKLERELVQTEDALEERQQRLLDLEEELKGLRIEAMREDFSKFEREIRSWEQQLDRAESNMKVYQKSIGDLENRRQAVTSSEDTTRSQLEKLTPLEQQYSEKITDLERRTEDLKQTLQDLEEERSIAQNRFNDAQLTHQDLKNRAENLERDIRRAETGISNINDRLKTRESLNTQSRERIVAYEATIRDTEVKLTAKQEQKREVDAALKEAESASSAGRGRIVEIEKGLKELRQRKEVNMDLLHHLTMAREKFEMQAQTLSDHVWETYGILMKQIEEELPEEMDVAEAKKQIASLKQRLTRIGDVNPLAIEQYREESERLEFLEEQVKDLVEAEAQLRETISEINETATARFNETFEQIRLNFKSVFNTLFHEDDDCDLLIEQDVEDPLEAKIEIRANPRGKRPSGINQLSGGEKTLTAIALLFAIYLVKPSPFCVLDEVDAPLDDANIERFANMIRNFSTETQFIIITHNKKTMSKAEMMYGVTMPETGVSRLVGVKLEEAAQTG